MDWFNQMPTWFKVAAVIGGLLGTGMTAGKTASDFAGHAALVTEMHAMTQEVKKQTCIQVAQLRHTDWTACIIPADLADGTH